MTFEELTAKIEVTKVKGAYAAIDCDETEKRIVDMVRALQKKSKKAHAAIVVVIVLFCFFFNSQLHAKPKAWWGKIIQ